MYVRIFYDVFIFHVLLEDISKTYFYIPYYRFKHHCFKPSQVYFIITMLVVQLLYCLPNLPGI